MKATAIAPANIAFIKFWGKADPKARVPQNDSISMNLSACFTTTTVEFLPELKHDKIKFIEEDIVKAKELERIKQALTYIRKLYKEKYFARVVTQNSFPKAAGIASSASGFASLTMAALFALEIKLPEKDISKLARTFSGTACRSIPDGFVEWQKGTGPDDSYAYSMYPPKYWDICDVLVIVSKTMKKVSTTEGHALAATSPFYNDRIKGMPEKIKLIKYAMQKKDFTDFGNIIENEALNMHAVMLTQTPSLIYWEPQTIEIMKRIQAWRDEKIMESYFTIDAGSSVHVICKKQDTGKLAKLLNNIPGVQQVIVNYPANGARIINEHLF